MCQYVSRLTALVLIVGMAANCRCATGDETDPAAAFKAAQSKIAHDLRHRDTIVRLAAVQSLGDYRLVDAARLLVPVLASTDGPLRRAAFEALAKISSDKNVAAYLKQQAAKHWKQPKRSAEGFGVIAILLGSESADDRKDAAVLIANAAERSPQGRMLVIDLVDQLGTGGGETSCRALVELAALPRAASDFGFLRATEQALTHLEVKSAVAALVEMLAAAKGEVRADIVRYLREISKEDFGGDVETWAAWWRDKEPTFEFPPPAARLALAGLERAQRPPDPQTPSYYGLPLAAAKIVFVIDISGSMQGPRIVAAKRELAQAVEALPAHVAFSIVAFHTRALVWQGKLVPASPEFKRNAQYFIAGLELGGKTASYDALEAALGFDAEAVYFLTDGAPTAGKIVSPPQIVTAITERNRYRRLTINALGVGVDTALFENFLATLAKENFGLFERVDR